MSYNYKKFIEDANFLIEKCPKNFKMNKQSFLNICYVKMNFELEDNILLEGDLLFSDVYNLPEIYFIIYNDGNVMKFDDYIAKYPSFNPIMMKGTEISKENHPLNGIVYDYMHLCDFNLFMNQLGNFKNTLIFWLSMALQIFNIDITKYIGKF